MPKPDSRAIVFYRFTDPGSELEMHANWMANTAIEELIGSGAPTGRPTLYNCLDRVIRPSTEWKKPRGDCLQVVTALVLTPEGFPLAYEVMPGNTNDRETQMPFIARLEEKYGKIGSL